MKNYLILEIINLLILNDNNYKDYVPIFLLYIFDAIIQIKTEKKLDDKTINNFTYN